MTNIVIQLRDDQTDEVLDTLDVPLQTFLGWTQAADAKNMSLSQYLRETMLIKVVEDLDRPKKRGKNVKKNRRSTT